MAGRAPAPPVAPDRRAAAGSGRPGRRAAIRGPQPPSPGTAASRPRIMPQPARSAPGTPASRDGGPASGDLCEMSSVPLRGRVLRWVPGRIPLTLHAPGKAVARAAPNPQRAFPDACNAAKRSGRRSGTQRQKLPRSGAGPTFAERRARPGGRILSRAFIGRIGRHREPEREQPVHIGRIRPPRAPPCPGTISRKRAAGCRHLRPRRSCRNRARQARPLSQARLRHEVIP